MLIYICSCDEIKNLQPETWYCEQRHRFFSSRITLHLHSFVIQFSFNSRAYMYNGLWSPFVWRINWMCMTLIQWTSRRVKLAQFLIRKLEKSNVVASYVAVLNNGRSFRVSISWPLDFSCFWHLVLFYIWGPTVMAGWCRPNNASFEPRHILCGCGLEVFECLFLLSRSISCVSAKRISFNGYCLLVVLVSWVELESIFAYVVRLIYVTPPPPLSLSLSSTSVWLNPRGIYTKTHGLGISPYWYTAPSPPEQNVRAIIWTWEHQYSVFP